MVKIPLSKEFAGGAHWHIVSLISEGATFHRCWAVHKTLLRQCRLLTSFTANIWWPRNCLGLDTGYMHTHAHSRHGVENTSIPGVTGLI